MSHFHRWSCRFVVRGIFWRRALDWAVIHVPSCLHPLLISFWTLVFSFWPGSSPLMNYLRTFRTFYNFAWTLTDAAIFRLLRAQFTYELREKIS